MIEEEKLVYALNGKLYQSTDKLVRQVAYSKIDNSIPFCSFLLLYVDWNSYDLYHTIITQKIKLGKLGKPLITLPMFENSPGVWELIDFETNITFIVTSDLYRKNSYKGVEIFLHNYKQESLVVLYDKIVKFFEGL